MRRSELLVIPVAGLLVSALLIGAHLNTPPPEVDKPVLPPPDFSAIKDIHEKKEAFFTYMLPLVRVVNQDIRGERSRLQAIATRHSNGNLTPARDRIWLAALAEKYRVTADDPLSARGMETLLRRVDIVPASLALAQAANESAWGTARFARHGKNYYGLWCWSTSCGLVPHRRDADKRHEVTGFETPEDSVRYYMLTLNSHPAYRDFRRLRASSRQVGEPLRGQTLAAGLLQYSERREAYVDEIRAMIRINQLQRFNQSLAQQPSG